MFWFTQPKNVTQKKILNFRKGKKRALGREEFNLTYWIPLLDYIYKEAVVEEEEEAKKMRQKRAKTYRKLLESYIRHFGLRPPLQVLLDAPMVLALVRERLSAHEAVLRLESVLQASAALGTRFNASAFASSSASGSDRKASAIKPMITQCCIAELYALQQQSKAEESSSSSSKNKTDEQGVGSSTAAAAATTARLAVDMAKTFERRRCNHRNEDGSGAIPGDRCLLDMLGTTNKHRYVLASDSPALRSAVRRDVLAVPVCHHNERKVMVLEPMSEKTQARCEELERAKLDLSTGGSGKRGGSDSILGKRGHGGHIVGLEDGDEEAADGDGQGKAKGPLSLPRKKRAKGPNPLSVKKSTSAKKKKQPRRKPEAGATTTAA